MGLKACALLNRDEITLVLNLPLGSWPFCKEVGRQGLFNTLLCHVQRSGSLDLGGNALNVVIHNNSK